MRPGRLQRRRNAAGHFAHYSNFDLAARQEAILFWRRRQLGLLLLDAIDESAIPRGDVSRAFHVQQLQSLANPQVGERLAKVWGAVRPTAVDARRWWPNTNSA